MSFAEALASRLPLFDAAHLGAVRLLNGFTEGLPGLVVEVYGRTLVLINLAADPGSLNDEIQAGLDFYRSRLPWLEAGLLKTRRSSDQRERLGRLLFGSRTARKIMENEVWYALDLRLNQDSSFYIDARGLRLWLKEHSAGLRVLNTFAYTGSLGVASMAGGAAAVVQSDLNRAFLNQAKASYALNGWPIQRDSFAAEDFFRLTARLRRAQAMFDLVILDPPFFADSSGGRVDLVGQVGRLINKVRPLVKDGGRLVAVNNALFVSGKAYLQALQHLGAGGWLELEELVPVLPDAAGAGINGLPADPSPFNHATKIAVLRVQRKDSLEDEDNSLPDR